MQLSLLSIGIFVNRNFSNSVWRRTMVKKKCISSKEKTLDNWVKIAIFLQQLTSEMFLQSSSNLQLNPCGVAVVAVKPFLHYSGFLKIGALVYQGPSCHLCLVIKSCDSAKKHSSGEMMNCWQLLSALSGFCLFLRHRGFSCLVKVEQLFPTQTGL